MLECKPPSGPSISFQKFGSTVWLSLDLAVVGQAAGLKVKTISVYFLE